MDDPAEFDFSRCKSVKALYYTQDSIEQLEAFQELLLQHFSEIQFLRLDSTTRQIQMPLQIREVAFYDYSETNLNLNSLFNLKTIDV